MASSSGSHPPRKGSDHREDRGMSRVGNEVSAEDAPDEGILPLVDQPLAEQDQDFSVGSSHDSGEMSRLDVLSPAVPTVVGTSQEGTISLSSGLDLRDTDLGPAVPLPVLTTTGPRYDGNSSQLGETGSHVRVSSWGDSVAMQQPRAINQPPLSSWADSDDEIIPLEHPIRLDGAGRHAFPARPKPPISWGESGDEKEEGGRLHPPVLQAKGNTTWNLASVASPSLATSSWGDDGDEDATSMDHHHMRNSLDSDSFVAGTKPGDSEETTANANSVLESKSSGNRLGWSLPFGLNVEAQSPQRKSEDRFEKKGLSTWSSSHPPLPMWRHRRRSRASGNGFSSGHVLSHTVKAQGRYENSPLHHTEDGVTPMLTPALVVSPKPLLPGGTPTKKRFQASPFSHLLPSESSKGTEGQDRNRSEVRRWKWWDNFIQSPGLVARLTVCALALCVLWSTSLNVAVDITSDSLHSPTLIEVVRSVLYTFSIIREERDAYTACVTRQSSYCDSDFSSFSSTAQEVTSATLSSTAEVVETTQNWTKACNASVSTSEIALRTWLSQGLNHTVPYSGNCSADDEALVRDLLGDPSPERESIYTEGLEFIEGSLVTVSELVSYAQARSEYDAEYAANKTTVFYAHAEDRLENVTLPFLEAISSSFEALAGAADTLIACVSPRNDTMEGDSCPGMESARELYDLARLQLENKLDNALDVVADMDEAIEDYIREAELSYEAMEDFFTGTMIVMSAVESAASAAYLELDSLISANVNFDYQAWTEVSLDDFALPVYYFEYSLLNISSPLSSDEIWSIVEGAYTSFSADLSAAAIDMVDLAGAWEGAAAEKVSNISASFALDDYNPPLYGNATDHNTSQVTIGSEWDEHQAAAINYKSRSLVLLNGLGPSGPNLSLPSAPALSTGISVSNASTTFTSAVEYSLAAFSSGSIDYGGALVSLGLLGALLIAADYIFRGISSLRLISQFWGRAGLNMPDVDIRVDRVSSATGSALSQLKTLALAALTHPGTMFLFMGVVAGLVTYNLATLYVPLFEDYQAGCVRNTKTGTFFTENLYSMAYNYAADEGNRDQWSFQDSFTLQRSNLCTELTAGVREALIEENLLLQELYEDHYENVAKVELLQQCLDITEVDALFEGACCGQDGYDSCITNSSLQCPMDYSFSVPQAYGTLGDKLDIDDCHSATLDQEHWQVKNVTVLDCDTIPSCLMTCGGPNAALLHAATHHTGCMVEWLFHAGWLKGVAAVVTFALMNVSRVILVGGFIKFYWRRMHPGIFTYKGTCTRAGELVVARPDELSDKAKQRDKRTKGEGEGGASVGGKGSHRKSLRDNTEPQGKKRWRRPWTRKERSPGDSSEAEGKGGGVGAGAGQGKGNMFKAVVAGAMEEMVEKYESTACVQVLVGLAINSPWVLMLNFLRRGDIEYRPVL